MNLKFNNYLFFNKREIVTKRKLLRIYGVKKNSYAGNVITRLYNSYYYKPIDIRKEFKKYYKKEFKSCVNYLVCRFNMSEELAMRIYKEKENYVDLDGRGEKPGMAFEYDDELRQQFWNIMGGIENES